MGVAVAVLVPLLTFGAYWVPDGARKAAADTVSGTWTATSRMHAARLGHTATRLDGPECRQADPPSYCGKVLVAGGRNDTGQHSVATVELYHPATRSWEVTADMRAARSGHTATLLADGRVLVVGGADTSGERVASAEIFDPALFRLLPSPPGGTARGVWITTGSPEVARSGHTATLVPDGRVLVAGGTDEAGEPVATAELFDPAAEGGLGAWQTTGAMSTARSGHTASLLDDAACAGTPVPAGCGRVLVAGGVDSSGTVLASSELFDAAGDGGAGAWAVTAPMSTARSGHTAVPLPDEQVLVAGAGTAEVFEVDANSGTGRWRATGPMAAVRSGHTATRLDGPTCPSPGRCGQVVVVGGADGAGHESASAEIFDPDGATWRATGGLLGARSGHAAALLSSGEVLVAGGTSTGGAVGSAEVFDPASTRQSPSVSGVTPSGGPLTGGTSVVLSGAGFEGATEVRFGERAARAFTVTPGTSGTRITAISPDHVAGTVDVTVTTPVGTSAAINVSRFTYAPPPTVSAIDPRAGPVTGGTQVTVTGTGFHFIETAVHFGAEAATSVDVLSDTELVAVSPPHLPGEVDVTVTTPAGTSAASFASVFSYGDGTWSSTGKLREARYHHSATLLGDGSVFVAGGTLDYGPQGPSLASSELYDPVTGQWTPKGSLNDARYSHTATLLDGPKCRNSHPPDYCGKVLVAGGQRQEPVPGRPGISTFVPLASSELYDPEQGTWARTEGKLGNARFSHTATLLDGEECRGAAPPGYCGKVLVAGGSLDELGRLPLDTAELYDPETEQWTPAGDLDPGCTSSSSRFCGRTNHTATLLPDGKVLVAGGIASDPAGRPPQNPNLLAAMAEIGPVDEEGRPAADMGPKSRSDTMTHTIVDTSEGRFPVLGVLVTATPDAATPVAPGSELTYSLAYFNTGQAPANGAVITDRLPPQVEFVSASGPAGPGTYAPDDHSVRFPPVSVPPGTTGADPAGTVHVQVRVKETANDAEVITNIAQIDASLSNTVTHQVTSSTTPASHGLGVTLTATPPSGTSVSPGQEVTYSLAYFNTSDSPVAARILTAPFAQMLRFVSLTRNGSPASCGPCTYDIGTRILTLGTLSIPPGTSADAPAETWKITFAVTPRVREPDAVLLRSAEVYDPVSDSWSDTGSLVVPRFAHTATLLATAPCGDHCGGVLVTGGVERLDDDRPVFSASAELYDPVTGRWGSADSMDEARAGHTATLLPDGKVLVAGSSMVFPHAGLPARLASAEVFDPLRAVGTQWRDTAPMLTARGIHSATLLEGGQCTSDRAPAYCGTILVAGGAGSGGAGLGGVVPAAIADAELYTPALSVPTITSVTPGTGPSRGGTTVVIEGSGFTGVSAVRFGDTPAAAFSVHSRTKITATAPPHPRGVVGVVVTAAGGRSAAGPGARFTYQVSQPPTQVSDLAARALSSSQVEVGFSAPASDGPFPPPAQRYIVKQATIPIRDEVSFSAGTTLCGGECLFSPASVGDRLTLLVTDLAPATGYHYAVRAVNEVGQVSAISNPASATTAPAPTPSEVAAPRPEPKAPAATTPTPEPTEIATATTPATQAGAEPVGGDDQPTTDVQRQRTVAGGSAGLSHSGPVPAAGARPPATAVAEQTLVAPPLGSAPVPSLPPGPAPLVGPDDAGPSRRWRTGAAWVAAMIALAGVGAFVNHRYRSV